MVALDNNAILGSVPRLRLSLAPLVSAIALVTVALVMALTAAPLKRLGGKVLIGERTRRTMLGTAFIYFWSCYSLMALARISGPHRPDVFYDISLSLMMIALLVRYADHWFRLHRPARKPEAASV